MRPLLLLLIGALLLPAALPPTSAQGGAYRIVLGGLDGAFTHEGWKEEQPVTGNLSKTGPVPALPAVVGVYRNPYFDGRPRYLPTGPVNAWGYHLNLTLRLADANDKILTNVPNNIFAEARIELGEHDIPAKMRKQEANNFLATFDLDGEAGKPWPAVGSGLLPVVVEVFEQPATSMARKVGEATLTVRAAFGAAGVPAVAFPRDSLQLYSDIGNFSALATRPYAPDETVPVTFSFGVANQNVRAVAVNTRVARTVFDGVTDAQGAVAFSLPLADVMGTAQGGLVLLEAHLVGSVREAVVGSGSVVIPVQSHLTQVSSIQREVRAGDADPAATMRIMVSDPDANPSTGGRHGRLLALDGVRQLASVPFLPADPDGDLNRKVARFPARFIAEADVASYTLYSLLFTERNEFYSLATAVRGYSIAAAPVNGEENRAGSLTLVVRNLNTNGDAVADPGLATHVRLRVTDLPGGANWTGEAALAEGEAKFLEVPFPASRAGTYTAAINSTSEELSLDRTARIQVAAPQNALGSLLDRLTPAPAAWALLALAAAAALALRRRA